MCIRDRVGFVRPGFTLTPDPREVEDTFEVPLQHIFDPANHRPQRRRSPFTGEEVDFIDIPYGERNVWGATSGMLMTLYRPVSYTHLDVYKRQLRNAVWPHRKNA